MVVLRSTTIGAMVDLYDGAKSVMTDTDVVVRAELYGRPDVEVIVAKKGKFKKEEEEEEWRWT